MCRLSWPTIPEIDEIFTMEPPPPCRMAGTACFMPRKTPLALMLMSVSQWGGLRGVGCVGAADPRVVHEDIEAPIGAHRGLDRLLPVELARHVELDELRLAAVGIDLLCHRVPVRLHHVGHHHDSSLAGEDEGLALAHPVRRARDHRHLAAKSHGYPPRWGSLRSEG